MTTSRSTATTTVLNTTELLEKIISFLAPEEIFTMLRVCKFWARVIIKSPDILKQVFLMPSGPTVAPRCATPHEAQPCTEYTKYLQINPICFREKLKRIGAEVSISQVLSLKFFIRRHPLGHVRDIRNGTSFENIRYPMFLTQPPCTTVALTVRGMEEDEAGYFEDSNYNYWSPVYDASGVKFDLILAHALSMTDGADIPEHIKAFRILVSFRAPLAQADDAIWEEKHQRARHHTEMMQCLRNHGGLPRRRMSKDVEELWTARMAEDNERKLQQANFEV